MKKNEEGRKEERVGIERDVRAKGMSIKVR